MAKIDSETAYAKIQENLALVVSIECSLLDRAKGLFHAADIMAYALAEPELAKNPEAAARFAGRKFLSEENQNDVFPRIKQVGDIIYAGFTFKSESMYALAIPRASEFLYESPVTKFTRRGIILPNEDDHLSARVLAPFP